MLLELLVLAFPALPKKLLPTPEVERTRPPPVFPPPLKCLLLVPVIGFAKAGELKAPAVTRIIAVRTTMIVNVFIFMHITATPYILKELLNHVIHAIEQKYEHYPSIRSLFITIVRLAKNIQK